MGLEASDAEVTGNNLDNYQHEINGNGYAWGGSAYRFVESHLKEVIQDTKGDVVIVDLCSSYPIYATILRSNHQKEARNIAVSEGISRLAEAIQSHKKNPPLSSISLLDEDTLRTFRDNILPKNSVSRKILTAIVQDTIDHPPLLDATNESTLADFFLSKFATQTHSYKLEYEVEGLLHEGRWEILKPNDEKTTLEKELETIIVNPEQRIKVLDNISQFLAERIQPHLRPYHVITVDLEDIEAIKTKAETSFPDWYQNTDFFRRAGDFKGTHIQANILQLPLAENSISLFTSLEGWPFYFNDSSLQEQTVLAGRLASSLKAGGRVIFFPWDIMNNDISVYGLNKKDKFNYFIQLWQALGLKVQFETYTRQDLIEKMSLRERTLVTKSPVFKDRDEFTSLVLIKPPAEEMGFEPM